MMLSARREHAPLPVLLSTAVAYVAPSGRWFRWCPAQGQTRNADGELFLYHLANGQPAPSAPRSEGFFLSEENLHLLKRMG